MELIIGDASISNPTLWHIGDVSLSFPEGSVSSPSQDYTYKVGPLLSIVSAFNIFSSMTLYDYYLWYIYWLLFVYLYIFFDSFVNYL